MPHIHEKIDFCVEVFIVHNNKVLLRVHDKFKVWLSVGGHIELDEDPNQAAVREVREEVGLDVALFDDSGTAASPPGDYTALIPPQFISRHHISDTHEHVAFVYFATTKDPAVIVSYDGDRSDEWGWFGRQELEALDLKADIRFYAERALDKLRTDPTETNLG